MRIENVAVEQMPRIDLQRMRHPCEAPDAEQRIGMRGDLCAEVQCLRPRQQDREHDEERQRAGKGIPSQAVTGTSTNSITIVPSYPSPRCAIRVTRSTRTGSCGRRSAFDSCAWRIVPTTLNARYA